MRETIYRDDAIKAMRECFQLLARPRVTAIKAINAIPSADRPQGKWIDADGNFVPLDKDGCTTASAWCSNCGEWLTGSDEYCTSGRFCPSCGARMKGADDEAD